MKKMNVAETIVLSASAEESMCRLNKVEKSFFPDAPPYNVRYIRNRRTTIPHFYQKRLKYLYWAIIVYAADNT